MHEESQSWQRKRGRLSLTADGVPPPATASMARSSTPADKPMKRHRGQEEEASQLVEKSSLKKKTPSAVDDAKLDVTCEVDEFMSERLHAVYYRQAYRMTPDHFWRLYGLLLPHFKAGDGSCASNYRNTCLALKISCALRFFAGGDSAGDHNIADAGAVEAYVWEVVDAIHACEGLAIEFPAADKQGEVAAGFELLKSDIGIPSCAGALGSMLVWIEPPATHSSPGEEEGSGEDSNIYYNRNLNKFGLSLQAVCDHDGRVLHASLDFPGSVSDGDAFGKSELSRNLKSGDLMARGVALFGGEAYTGCGYVVAPIDAPESATERLFNDYHRQLTEAADSAFLSLLRRWSLLRRPLPQRFGVAKQRALALALVKLHNFCMDDTEPMLPALAKDMLYGFDRGAFVLKEPALNASSRGDKAAGSGQDGTKCELIGCGGRMLSRQSIPSATAREAEIRQQVLELVNREPGVTQVNDC